MASTSKQKAKQSTNLVSGNSSAHLPLNLTQDLRRKIYLMIFAISFLFYGNTLWNGYSMDDDLVIKDHPLVQQGVAGIPKIFLSRYSINEKQSYEYRPVTLTVFALEYQFFGSRPGISHFINILLYALIGIILFELLSKIFIHEHWILPVAAVLVFMIHPLHSEVVASIKNRDEILAVLFSLLALHMVIFYMQAQRKWKFLIYIFFLIILANLSKKSAITILALVPLVVFFITPKEKFSFISYARRSFLPVLSVILAFIAIRLGMLIIFGQGSASRHPLYFENPLYEGGFSFVDKVAIGGGCFWFYLQKLFIPYPLVSYYGFSAYSLTTWSSISTWLGWISVLGITYVAFRKINSRSPWIFGWFYFLITISMFTNILAAAPGIVADRFAFSASIGFSLIISWLVFRFFSDRFKLSLSGHSLPGKIRFAGIVLVLVCSVLVINRNRDWKSAATLYLSDIQKVPQSAKLNSLMATELSNQVLLSMRSTDKRLTPLAFQQKTDSAINYFEAAIEVYPDYAAVHNNVGTIQMMAKENHQLARYHFKRAVEIDSAYTQAWFNLAFQYQFDNEVYDLLLMPFNYFTPENLSEKSESRILGTNEVWKLGISLQKLQKASIGYLRNILQSKTNDEFLGKLKNLESGLNGYVKTYFAGSPFVPKQDSFAAITSKRVNDILVNNYGGDPETVVRNSIYKFIGTQVAVFLLQFTPPSGKSSWIDYLSDREKVTRDSLIFCYNKTLHYKPSMNQAFKQLNDYFSMEEMNDSIIALNQRMLKESSYQSEQLHVYIANAFVAKGDIKSAIRHYDSSAVINERIIERLSVIQLHMNHAGNQSSGALLMNWHAQKTKELKAIYQILSSKYFEVGDVEKGNEYQRKVN